MRKGKVFEKFKRILISIMCVVTLVFAMPVKAEATVVEDFFSLFAYIGDIPMWFGNVFLDPYETDDSYYDFNTKGVNFGGSDEGGIRNFSVTPYDVFTSGMKVEELDKKGEPTGSYYIKLPLLASNFFSNDYPSDGVTNSAEILRPVIANIYKQLRNLCLILMMLVLVYIGIKIILSSVAAEQAKYKQWLVDWLVSLCLLFAMHYIMSFLMNINEVILNMLKNDEGDSYYVSLGEQGDGTRAGSDWVTAFNDAPEFAKLHLDIPDQNFEGGSSGFWTLKDNDQPFPFDESTHTIQVDTRTDWGDNGKIKISAEIYDKDRPDDRHRAVYKANLVEFVRTISDYGASYVTIYNNSNEKKNLSNISEDEDEADNFLNAAYVTLYLLLVVETIMFVVTYIKRVFQLAFFTMIAPLVAFMYPIDKIGDGKAQAFNTWLKDYIFNVLIQPLHLLIYTIFIVAARDLFAENIIYAIAIYGMMLVAEKYFKKIFGFDKSSTGGGGPMAGAIGAGLGMRGLDKLTGLGPPGGGKGHGGGSKGGEDKNKIRLKKSDLPNSKGENKDGTGSGTSSATRNGSRLPGGAGNGSRLPSGAGNARKGSQNINNMPDSLGNSDSKHKRAKAFGKMAKRRFARAVTGGKYNGFKGQKVGDVAGAIAGNYGRKIGRTGAKIVGRAALGVVGGTVGLMGSTISAMATGDVNNLFKGVSVGATAGIARGGKFGDFVSDKAGDYWQESREARAEDDDEYRERLRIQEARMSFQESNLTDEELGTVDKYAPYVNFDGNEDKASAFHKLDEEMGGDIEETVTLSKKATQYGNLNEQKKRDELREDIEKELIEQNDKNHIVPQKQPTEEEILNRSIEVEKRHKGAKKSADEYLAMAKEELEYEEKQKMVKDEADKRVAAARKYYNAVTK